MANLDRHLVTLTAPASFAAEQYQGLRLTIERLSHARDIRMIAVTSPAAGDGKSVTSVNLAGALARGTDDRVLLIDADLRRPSVSGLLGLNREERGLAEALGEARLPFTDTLQPTPLPNLSMLPAGLMRGGVSELLRSSALDTILRQARQRYSYVIVDTPPLLPVFDSALLAKLVDGVLVVVSANQTPRKLLGEALNMLEPSKVLGIVFNRDERPLFGYYNSYNRYYREYFTDPSQLPSRA
jgi:capsular exopolysaccharide synthesis family protein